MPENRTLLKYAKVSSHAIGCPRSASRPIILRNSPLGAVKMSGICHHAAYYKIDYFRVQE